MRMAYNATARAAVRQSASSLSACSAEATSIDLVGVRFLSGGWGW